MIAPCHPYEIMGDLGFAIWDFQKEIVLCFCWGFSLYVEDRAGYLNIRKIEESWREHPTPDTRLPGSLFCSSPDSPSDFGHAMTPPGLQSHLSLSLRALSTPNSAIF